MSHCRLHKQSDFFLFIQLNRLNRHLYLIHLHLHLAINRRGRWDTRDDFTTTSLLHSSLFPTVIWDLANSRRVHSLMLSSRLFFCMPCFRPPFTVPCKMDLTRPDEQETWPHHCSLRLFTMNRRSSCDPIACWILTKTSLSATWSLYEIFGLCFYIIQPTKTHTHTHKTLSTSSIIYPLQKPSTCAIIPTHWFWQFTVPCLSHAAHFAFSVFSRPPKTSKHAPPSLHFLNTQRLKRCRHTAPCVQMHLHQTTPANRLDGAASQTQVMFCLVHCRAFQLSKTFSSPQVHHSTCPPPFPSPFQRIYATLILSPNV